MGVFMQETRVKYLDNGKRFVIRGKLCTSNNKITAHFLYAERLHTFAFLSHLFYFTCVRNKLTKIYNLKQRDGNDCNK